MSTLAAVPRTTVPPASSSSARRLGVDVARLRRFDLLAPLSERELAALALHCEEAAVPAGAIVIRQGQVAKHIYFLEDGAVNVYRERLDRLQKVALIESPGVFGEMALINRDRVRTATVRAATDLRFFSIPFSDLIVALRCIPVLREQLRELMQQRCLGEPGPATADAAAPQPETAIAGKLADLCG